MLIGRKKKREKKWPKEKRPIEMCMLCEGKKEIKKIKKKKRKKERSPTMLTWENEDLFIYLFK